MQTPNVIDKVSRAVTRNDQLKREKTVWNEHWQLLGEYIHMRKQNFTSTQQDGDFLSKELFDNTASKSNNTMASSLIGMLWPNGAKSFRLAPPSGIKETSEVKRYYEFVTARMAEAMDDPKAGLATALDEYMKDQGCFGTSGIEIMPGRKDSDLSYKAWSVKEMSIDEGRDGFVDSIFIEIEWTLRQAALEYGLEKLSEKSRELIKNGKLDDKIKILIAIEPRLEFTPGMEGNRNMPFQSLHIELSEKNLLREAGFEDLPLKVGRFWKILKEKYGRSPGMEALPDVLELNAIWESITVAIEKMLDPPLGILDDGRLGGGTIDTSAGAINVFNITGRAGERQPVFPLYTVGELQHVGTLIDKLTESISNHFFIDRLLDLNNENEMTLGEAQIRNKLRGGTLGSIFARQIAEVFDPLIERTFNVLFKAGKLGVAPNSLEHFMKQLDGEDPVLIPDEIVEFMKNGRDAYKIKYITPAARIMDAEEAQGIVQTWELAGTMCAVNQEVIDNLDADESIKRFALISGAPSTILRAKGDVDTIRKARQDALAQAQQLQAAKAGAGAAKDAAQAQKTAQETKQMAGIAA